MTTPTPLPESKANELIEEINSVGSDEVLPERLAEIEFEAIKLEEADPISSYVLRGVISGIRRKHTEIEKHFTNALNEGATGSYVLANYAAALVRVGEFEKALNLIDEAANTDSDIELIKRACKLHLLSYDAIGAGQYLELLYRMGIQDAEVEVIQKTISNIDDIFSAHDIDWRMAASRVSLTMKTVLEVTPSIHGNNLFLHDGVIVHQYVVQDDLEKVSAAESAMLDVIANQCFDPVDNVLSFSCSVQ